MPDFSQHGPITTIHDLGTTQREELMALMRAASSKYRIGLLLPITAADMRAEPFSNIIKQLVEVEFIDTIVVVLNKAEEVEDYQQTVRILAPLGERAQILWTDGPRGKSLITTLVEQ